MHLYAIIFVEYIRTEQMVMATRDYSVLPAIHPRPLHRMRWYLTHLGCIPVSRLNSARPHIRLSLSHCGSIHTPRARSLLLCVLSIPFVSSIASASPISWLLIEKALLVPLLKCKCAWCGWRLVEMVETVSVSVVSWVIGIQP
jgi:hypothetical protein